MTYPAKFFHPVLLLLLATSFFLATSETEAARILNESFENADSNDDPIGWETSGHPNYVRIINESDDNWTTPYGESALSTYSSGIATKGLGVIPAGSEASGEYVVKFNISSSSNMGEYRAVLEVWDWDNEDWMELGSVVGDTDGTKDFSYSDEIRWRYNYEDWPDPLYPGFSYLESADLRIRLMQDPDRSNWQHTPRWDNVTVDYIPDIDTEGPELIEFLDDNQGSLIVATNAIVTYTAIFSEAIDPATVDSADFNNAGSSDIVIESVSPGEDDTSFIVEVRPTTPGSLRLAIAEGAIITDIQSNPMNTGNYSALQDDTNFTVESGIPTILPSDFVDDQEGGPIPEDRLVTYTLTFSTAMNLATISAADFVNAGNASITIGAIAQPSPGVVTVQVTPTGSGSLRLSIAQSVSIEAADGGVLNTSSAIIDDTTIIVDSVLPLVTEIKDEAEGAPIAVGGLLVYEVFFSEAMDASTVEASDFGNAVTSGAAGFNIDLVEEASPGLFRIEVTPTSTGTIQLQINPEAEMLDLVGNALDTTEAIPDDTIITVEALDDNPYDAWSGGSAAFADDANGDGISNGLAWLLGAADPAANALSLLPSTSVTASGDLVLSFRCLKSAHRGGASIKVQHSADLGTSDLWSGNEAEVPDASSTVNGITFVTSDDGDYINVTATIPASAAGSDNRLFARIIAEMP